MFDILGYYPYDNNIMLSYSGTTTTRRRDSTTSRVGIMILRLGDLLVQISLHQLGKASLAVICLHIAAIAQYALQIH